MSQIDMRYRLTRDEVKSLAKKSIPIKVSELRNGGFKSGDELIYSSSSLWRDLNTEGRDQK